MVSNWRHRTNGGGENKNLSKREREREMDDDDDNGDNLLKVHDFFFFQAIGPGVPHFGIRCFPRMAQRSSSRGPAEGGKTFQKPMFDWKCSNKQDTWLCRIGKIPSFDPAEEAILPLPRTFVWGIIFFWKLLFQQFLARFYKSLVVRFWCNFSTFSFCWFPFMLLYSVNRSY